jgi:hypothetical protein
MSRLSVGGTLVDRVLAVMAEHARTGAPIEDGTRWTCGRCYREEGVKQFVVAVPAAEGGFEYRLVCPCCSFVGCPHRGRP